MTEAGSQERIMVGIDENESETSLYALQWTLRHFFSISNPLFKLDLVEAARLLVANSAGPGFHLRCDRTIMGKALQLCNSVGRSLVGGLAAGIHHGDARDVFCEEAESRRADVLVVGIHGAVPGSVADYCAHHAPCTVIIVRKPEQHEH